MRGFIATACIAALASLAPVASVEAVNVRDHRSPSVSAGAYPLQAPGVFEMTLFRQAGQTTTCETRNLRPRTDPVLHVLKFPGGPGSVNELARDDDSAGALNAWVTFTAPSTGPYLLILRAAWAGGVGTADLFCDGQQVWTGIGVAGAFKRLENLDNRETLRTVTGPGGPGLHTLYLLGDDGKMLSRTVSNASDSALVDGGLTGLRIAMVAGRWPDPTGEIRLIRNDNKISGHDPDGDGLGSRLETSIGTCSSLSDVVMNFECSRAADPRDTDGDGLQDGLEMIGKLDAAPYQHLPRWGADPRHKDLFIEVDFGLSSPAEAQQTMSPAQAAAFMNVYGDGEPDALLQLLHAQQLVNPDLKPGVNTHLDIGADPPAGSSRLTLTTYGDWGGHSVVQPVCDASGACVRASAGSVYQTMMDPARRGLFHYALGDPGGGGQAGPGIALNFPMGSGVTAAHETGHTLSLNHEGKPPGVNCSPAYPSVMNYAFQSKQPAAFSDGFGRPAVNDVNLRESPGVTSPTSLQSSRFLQDLKKVYDLTVDTASGAVDWNRDGVYSPGTVRAYASYAPRASGGCEITRDSQMFAQGRSDVAPAMARLERHVMLLYINEADRTLQLEATASDLNNCPKLMADCGGLTPHPVAEPWNTGILSVDAQTLTTADGAPRVLVVFRTAKGLFETTFGRMFDWTPPKPIATSAPAIAEISLTGKGDRAWLAFRTVSGSAITKARAGDGSWGADEPAVDGVGAPIDVASGTAPGILLFTDMSGAESLLGAFPVQPSGGLTLYQRKPTGGAWTPFPAQPRADPVFGRPALAAVPVAADSPLRGQIKILYVKRSGATANVVMQANLIASDVGPGAQPKFVTAQHDNVWFYGNGVDLLFEPGVDSNLRAAVSTALIERNRPAPHRVALRPKADGIVDFDQKNFSDWSMIGYRLCTLLKANGASVNCPPAP
jgi:hypothetical protein